MRRKLITLVAGLLVILIAFAAVNWMTPGPGRTSATASGGAPLLQSASFSQDPNVTRPGISVTGQGSVSVKPDIARVTLGVEVSNTSATRAQQDAAAKMDAVVTELKKQGISDKDIQTVRVDLSPEYDYSSRNPVLKGYRATNLVTITSRDLSKLGGLLDAVANSGATRIQGIAFSVSDPTAAGAQGREQAMKDAKAKADQLAKLSGVLLGSPLSIEETVSAPAPAMEPQLGPAARAAETPISPGTQEVRTVVKVIYGIK